jgi:molecular chaperone GrpE
MEKEPLNHTEQPESGNTEPKSADTEPAKAEKKDEAAEEKPKKGFFSSTGKTKKLQEEIEVLKLENAELKDKALRAVAELDNYRKRTKREMEELIGTASEGLMKSLLPVLDDIDRAQANLEQTNDLEALREGFALIMGKLRKTLEQRGLQAMNAIHTPFDPEQHEAIARVPAPDAEMHGKVMDEVEKGYLMNGKIIRYARVVVANNSDEQA